MTSACHGGVTALLRGLSATTLTLLLMSPDALAQSRPKIWDMAFGTPVADLPDEEFVDPACGTNGGPPGLRLTGFEEFGKCRTEASGLREIWFRYDDEEEYIARAVRNPDAVARANTMMMLGQPIMLSLLADRVGRLQGYRIFTDPRADADLRKDAYLIGNAFKARYGNDGWDCKDRPPARRRSRVSSSSSTAGSSRTGIRSQSKVATTTSPGRPCSIPILARRQ